jgi:hypothetical protein
VVSVVAVLEALVLVAGAAMTPTDGAQYAALASERRRSKYGNRAVYIGGQRFASKREAERYAVLALMQAAGEIQALLCQVPYVLGVGCGKRYTPIGKYVADFRYKRGDEWVVEDAKGFRTPLYRWKKRHFEAEYGLRIEEI